MGNNKVLISIAVVFVIGAAIWYWRPGFADVAIPTALRTYARTNLPRELYNSPTVTEAGTGLAIPRGTRVEVLSGNGPLYKVRVGTRDGWMYLNAAELAASA